MKTLTTLMLLALAATAQAAVTVSGPASMNEDAKGTITVTMTNDNPAGPESRTPVTLSAICYYTQDGTRKQVTATATLTVVRQAGVAWASPQILLVEPVGLTYDWAGVTFEGDAINPRLEPGTGHSIVADSLPAGGTWKAIVPVTAAPKAAQ
jgi:hypothetical protein